MLNMRIDEAKSLFFDRPAVKSMMDRVSHRALGRFGSYLRTVARNLIKKRGKPSSSSQTRDEQGRFLEVGERPSGYFDASKPGQPPHRHSGHLHDFLFFAYDSSSQSVVVGPAYLSGRKADDVPAILEYGGVTTITSGKNRGKKKYIAPRPYMGPAFDAAEPKLPEMWDDAWAEFHSK